MATEIPYGIRHIYETKITTFFYSNLLDGWWAQWPRKGRKQNTSNGIIELLTESRALACTVMNFSKRKSSKVTVETPRRIFLICFQWFCHYCKHDYHRQAHTHTCIPHYICYYMISVKYFRLNYRTQRLQMNGQTNWTDCSCGWEHKQNDIV